MVPMRDFGILKALPEPAAPKGAGQLWESGAEDARTPNAGASSDGSLEVAKRLECVRFIGAFAPAWSSQRFMVPMRAKFGLEAFHEPERRSPTRHEPRDLSERAGSETGAPMSGFRATKPPRCSKSMALIIQWKCEELQREVREWFKRPDKPPTIEFATLAVDSRKLGRDRGTRV